MRTFQTLFCLLSAAVLMSCTSSDSPSPEAPQPVSIVTGGEVFGPRFSKGHDDRLVLSWMERGETSAVLRYATLTDEQFTPAREVTTESRMFVNWADLPSVTTLSEDHWLAHWLRYSADKTYSYDVVVAQSFDDGDTWSEAIPAHTDGTPTEHGFVSVLGDENGALLVWLDGRNTPASSMTLRSAVITPESTRNSEQEIDNSVCDCCQTDIALAASGPIAVYRDRTREEIRDIYLSRRIDGQWQPGTRLFADNWQIAGCPVNGPSIIADGERVTIAWFSAADDKPVVRAILSSDSGQSFGDPVEIATGRIAGYVGLTAVDDHDAVVSWVARNDDGDNSLRLRRVSANGTAGPVVDVGETSQLRVFPQLAYADGYLYLAWTTSVDGASQLRAARLSVGATT